MKQKVTITGDGSQVMHLTRDARALGLEVHVVELRPERREYPGQQVGFHRDIINPDYDGSPTFLDRELTLNGNGSEIQALATKAIMFGLEVSAIELGVRSLIPPLSLREKQSFL